MTVAIENLPRLPIQGLVRNGICGHNAFRPRVRTSQDLGLIERLRVPTVQHLLDSQRKCYLMSGSSRRQKIQEMLQQEPDDVFLRYSLAMEFSNEGRTEESLALLQKLCEQAPPYVPAYFRSAQILADNDSIEQSRDFLRRGIEAARDQGDLHAAAEMGEMLSDLGSS